MRTIWKFEMDLLSPRVVEGTPVLTYELPYGAVVLDVQVQHGAAVFWVELNDVDPKTVQRFAVVVPGLAIPDFVNAWEGTWQDGVFVWHLYSVDEASFRLAVEREAQP